MKGKELLCGIAFAMVGNFLLMWLTGRTAIHTDLPVWRFAYVFFHAGWLHLICNVMCIVAIVRSAFRITAPMVAAAYIIAVLSPMSHDIVTFGGSGVCYALLGMMAWQSIAPCRFHGIMAVFLTLGFFSPSVNAMLHLFCYVEGVLFGWLWKD